MRSRRTNGCQNASRPGRHQIGVVGEIISESWGRIKSVHPAEIIGICTLKLSGSRLHGYAGLKGPNS
jgi:hypothetical protein